MGLNHSIYHGLKTVGTTRALVRRLQGSNCERASPPGSAAAPAPPRPHARPHQLLPAGRRTPQPRDALDRATHATRHLGGGGIWAAVRGGGGIWAAACRFRRGRGPANGGGGGWSVAGLVRRRISLGPSPQALERARWRKRRRSVCSTSSITWLSGLCWHSLRFPTSGLLNTKDQGCLGTTGL